MVTTGKNAELEYPMKQSVHKQNNRHMFFTSATSPNTWHVRNEMFTSKPTEKSSNPLRNCHLWQKCVTTSTTNIQVIKKKKGASLRVRLPIELHKTRKKESRCRA